MINKDQAKRKKSGQEDADENKANRMGRAILPLAFRDIIHQTPDHVWLTVLADVTMQESRDNPLPDLDPYDSFEEYQQGVVARGLMNKHVPKAIARDTQFEDLIPS